MSNRGFGCGAEKGVMGVCKTLQFCRQGESPKGYSRGSWAEVSWPFPCTRLLQSNRVNVGSVRECAYRRAGL